MDALYCPSILDWPCLSQSEWAAWIQVIGAIVALFLAIYVPIRMRRIEELDRRQAAVDCVTQLHQVANYYATAIDQLDKPLGTPFIELTAAISAASAHMQNPGTPPEVLPSIGHAVDAAKKMMNDWKRAAEDSVYRQNMFTVKHAREHRDRIGTHLTGLQNGTRHWRKRHCIALAFY